MTTSTTDGITELQLNNLSSTQQPINVRKIEPVEDDIIKIFKQKPDSRVVPLEDMNLLVNDNKIHTMGSGGNIGVGGNANEGLRVADVSVNKMSQHVAAPTTVEKTTELTDILMKPLESVNVSFENSNSNGNSNSQMDDLNLDKLLNNLNSQMFAQQGAAQTQQPSMSDNNIPPPQPTTTLPSDTSIFSSREEPEKPKIQTYEEIQQEKQELLFKLERLQNKGTPLSRNYTMASNIEDIRNEYRRIKAQNDIKNSVKFQRRMMMAAVTGVEFLSCKFNYFDVKLDGWSETVHESLSEYDEIFEELHEKYKERTKMSPELRLVLSLSSSMVMYHLTQSFIKSNMPSMTDVFNQNPDLMRSLGGAISNTMSNNPETSGFGNFMGDLFKGAGQQQQQQSPPPTPPRREMKGPSGVDNILRGFGNMQQPQPSHPMQSQPQAPPPRDRVSSVSSASLQDLEMLQNKYQNAKIGSSNPPNSNLNSNTKKTNGGVHLSF